MFKWKSIMCFFGGLFCVSFTVQEVTHCDILQTNIGPIYMTTKTAKYSEVSLYFCLSFTLEPCMECRNPQTFKLGSRLK